MLMSAALALTADGTERVSLSALLLFVGKAMARSDKDPCVIETLPAFTEQRLSFMLLLLPYS